MEWVNHGFNQDEEHNAVVRKVKVGDITFNEMWEYIKGLQEQIDMMKIDILKLSMQLEELRMGSE